MSERGITITTADGTADGFLYRPEEREHPGVIFLPDGIGLRPSQQKMAERVSDLGYVVLLPNIYYRSGRPPFLPPKPDFKDEKIAARFRVLTSKLPPDAMERDGSAYVDFLAKQPGVNSGPMGIVGFCFSGQFALRVAAARPDRVGVAASFHGGGLVKDEPTSPHLQLPRVKARLYFGHARDDRSMPAEAIAKFEQALAKWGGQYESETYNANHGWTVPDSAAYDKPEAERAFAKLTEALSEL
jgi:carboxymethylenebutenolidase